MSESYKDKAVALGYSAGWGLVRLAPEPLARGVFRRGADLAFHRGAGAQLRKNLARVLAVPADQVPDSLVRRSLRSYARYWREAFRLPAMDHARLAREVNAAVAQQHHLDEPLKAGRGVVIVLPHMGNWDLAGVWLAVKHGQFTTVAERLKPESLYQKFLAYRESLGFEILPHASLSAAEAEHGAVAEAAGGGPYRILAQRLREGKVVCLLADRGMSRGSVPVRFFGETARFPPGPARLAAATGAALVTAHTWYEPEGSPEGRWRAEVGPAINVEDGVEAATGRVAAAFEAAIAARPEDWHMLQPLWDADRGSVGAA
ncbi:lipid A biosynthesis acyltransferase [Segniliparus rotundus DSM 44985]|uniref:Lipid A biosynthesis acyltransferase n=1 Tax=Segniliparus rotundus (strain ATCC BAA-972 / CDC 1076 / CIP 108378 / DSM 44985 / JCM 13578) TaxID=640132 RepID=D6Z8I5_SEGRD|nr:phosphatidylinositol mannoside acyltransferase [Segniliparus rotundus]ADG98265.1 lipid A biosynthesis acyltransferase [Segniliparus rotundus DSM 44985]